MGKGNEPGDCCFTHVLGYPMAGLAPGREETVAGGQGQLGSRRGGWRLVLLTLALLWDVMVKEAEEVKQQP